MQKRNGREWPVSEATLYPWQWDSSSRKLIIPWEFQWILSSLIGRDLGAFTRSTVRPAPQAVSWLGKMAKGEMHEQPRWEGEGKVMMEGDEWRRFRDAEDSGAGIEAIKLLRIF